MRVALAQLNPVSGDIDGNAANDRRGDRRGAAAGGADLRRRAGDGAARLLHRRPGRGRRLPRRQRAGDRSASRRPRRGITAVVGFIDFDLHQRNDNGTVRKYNAAAVVRDGRVLQRARKSLLPNYRYFDDKRFFTPGEARASRSTSPGRGGTVARRRLDLRGHVGRLLRRQAAAASSPRKGAAVLLNLNASPFYPGKRHERDALIRRHIAQVRKPLVYVNTVGRRRQRQEHHPVRRREPGLRRARPAHRDRPAVRRGPARRRSRSGATPHAVRSSCRRSIASARSTTRWSWRCATTCARPASPATVVPVSGGIDSALALAIAVDALGAGQRHAPSTCRRNTTPRRPARSPSGWRPRSASRYGVIPISAIDDEVQRGLRSARASDRAQPHAREPARAHPRAADDGRVERHRRAADLLRQRNRDRARLRDALRRHVRRHLAHRRPVEDRRLPAGALRQPRGTAARSIPEETFTHQAVGRARRRTSSTRSTTPSWRRSSASSSSAAAAPAELVAPVRAAARSIPAASCPTPRAGRSTTSTRPRRFRAVVDDAVQPHAPLGLQAAAGPADRRRQRAGVRLRSAGDDHQRLGGLSARAH